MTHFNKLVQIVIKVCGRFRDYLRGMILFIIIVLCGGKCCGIPRVGKSVVFKYPPHKGLCIGKKCDIGPFCIFDVPPGGELRIGDNVKLTAGVVLSSINKIIIGDNCLLAEWVSIRDAQHEFRANSPISSQGLSSAPIVLESDVWVGRSGLISQGAYLEKGCIVGAHGLVKRERLQSYGIYVGIPVKKIGQRT